MFQGKYRKRSIFAYPAQSDHTQLHGTYQVITRAPRMLGGAISALYTGTVTSLSPMPTPRRIRQTTSSPQCLVSPIPIGESRENMAPMKMVCRRPKSRFRGSESQPALPPSATPSQYEDTYKTQMQMYGQAFMKPTIHEYLSQSAGSSVPALQPSESGSMPKWAGNDKLAPFDPVWSQP